MYKCANCTQTVTGSKDQVYVCDYHFQRVMNTLVQWWLLVHIFSSTGFSQGGQQLPMSITSASGPIQPGRVRKKG